MNPLQDKSMPQITQRTVLDEAAKARYSEAMKASVLGIGTELTDGQIVNKNGAWISARLKEKGFISSLHLVVPDERLLILEALRFCAQHSDCLFVTGGLGPTSDDFTRDIVAEWAQLPLEFDEASWRHVQDRLSGRGFAVREIQKQQCYFPRGAEVLVNDQGTANAFTFEARRKKVFVLPGPPREIEAVWKTGIAAWLEEKSAGHDPFVTRKWDTLGRGESDIAILAEEALEGVQIEKGYRVHLPYVEVKVSYFKSAEKSLNAALEKLELALKPYTVARDGEDLAARLVQDLERLNEVHFRDEVSGGFLMGRIFPFLRDKNRLRWSFANSPRSDTAAYEFCLLPHDEFSAKAILKTPHRTWEGILSTPYQTANMAERRRQYLAERALIFWRQNLNSAE